MHQRAKASVSRIMSRPLPTRRSGWKRTSIGNAGIARRRMASAADVDATLTFLRLRARRVAVWRSGSTLQAAGLRRKEEGRWTEKMPLTFFYSLPIVCCGRSFWNWSVELGGILVCWLDCFGFVLIHDAIYMICASLFCHEVLYVGVKDGRLHWTYFWFTVDIFLPFSQCIELFTTAREEGCSELEKTKVE